MKFRDLNSCDKWAVSGVIVVAAMAVAWAAVIVACMVQS